MPEAKTYRFSRLLKLSVAMLVAAGVLIISVSAVGNKEKEKISGIQVKIQGANDQAFISQDEILSILNKASGKAIKNQPVSGIDLTFLEKKLRKNNWVKKAELFIDNRNVLRVTVEEKTPVARVFGTDGNSFYVTDDIDVLPLSDRVSARVPFFTSYVGNRSQLKKRDSLMLKDIATLATFIQGNDFWMAQIDQVDITSSQKFELYPKLGNQVIRFGDAVDCAGKFNKLLAFYKQVSVKAGWNKYSVIDVQYKNQVVAERRDASQIKADSLAAIRIMKSVIENARKNSSDSSHIQLPSKESSERGVLKTHSKAVPDDVIQEVVPEKLNPPGSVSQASSTTTSVETDGGVPKTVMTSSPKEAPGKTKIPATEKKIGTKKDEKQNGTISIKTNEPARKTEKKVPKAVMPAKNDY